ncbi:MAG: PH domain-containing protein [Defluviitaleaceae bacterium]|nr:PH domain-containing protein [Defluviitaleaceae bacterium]
MKFKAKVDWRVHILLAATTVMLALVAAGAVWSAWLGEDVAGAVITIVLIVPLGVVPMLLIIPSWLNTYYVLDDDCLIVKSGLFRPRRIPYDKIRKAAPFRSWWISSPDLISPVFSFDMIELAYANPNFIHSIIIAPRDRDEFLRQLELRRQGPGGGAGCGLGRKLTGGAAL